jgi:hypothetical protein
MTTPMQAIAALTMGVVVARGPATARNAQADPTEARAVAATSDLVIDR